MTETKLTLPGNLRIKKNSKRIFSRGRYKTVLPSEAYEEWEAYAIAAARHNWPLPGPVEAPVEVEAHIYFTGPQPDLSGCLESIGDALEGVAWVNDRQIVSWDGSRLHRVKPNGNIKPQTVLTIRVFE